MGEGDVNKSVPVNFNVNHFAAISFFTALVIISGSCGTKDNPSGASDYRREMRDLVTAISRYADSVNPGFIVIPQNGIELVTSDGEASGTPVLEYLEALDGVGQEDLLFGYDQDDQATPEAESDYLRAFLEVAKNDDKVVLVTDYCSTESKVDQSYGLNSASGYISFAANSRELDQIPPYPAEPFDVNALEVQSLSMAENFLYLLNFRNYGSKGEFISAVTSTDYDLLITDLFFEDDSSFTPDEVEQLRTKSNGGKRLVICYLSIGEAERYRYYWQPSWSEGDPFWLLQENPDWEGNYKVMYWEKEWQQILFGNDDSYLKKILDAGFDGVYLDIIDAFEYFE
jgi:cysteinyl-tRNA synthetase